MNQQLIEFRKELHKHPELSNQEENTAGRIRDWLDGTYPDLFIDRIGGHGLAAVWDSKKPGPSLLFRCELDALPLNEISVIPHRSIFQKRGHLCGHDGHMAILSGLALHLKENRPATGKVILLFQPAEETGEGAKLVISDERIKTLAPDYVFALHNLPGFKSNALILADQHFSAASSGLEIRLTGKSSHAAEPENGINPAMAVARIVSAYHDMVSIEELFQDFILLTIIHIALGGKAYGTSPGEAELRATLRAYKESDLEKLKKISIQLAEEIAGSEGLTVSHKWTEVFPATLNHLDAVDLIKGIAERKKWETVNIRSPFKWSEDFGHFTQAYKGAMIGIGSGTHHPSLHNPDYDFPDEILERGVELFASIYHALIP